MAYKSVLLPLHNACLLASEEHASIFKILTNIVIANGASGLLPEDVGLGEDLLRGGIFGKLIKDMGVDEERSELVCQKVAAVVSCSPHGEGVMRALLLQLGTGPRGQVLETTGHPLQVPL